MVRKASFRELTEEEYQQAMQEQKQIIEKRRLAKEEKDRRLSKPRFYKSTNNLIMAFGPTREYRLRLFSELESHEQNGIARRSRYLIAVLQDMNQLIEQKQKAMNGIFCSR